tara:strand:+ start:204 stop:530 length:327 start_codon:yes stop_codon:yes gene_type:complete
MKKKFKIKKNDEVMVIAGNDKGSTGRVLDTNQKEQRVLVEGINMRKRHEKPSQTNQQGGIIEIERPIHCSNVMLLDSDGNPSKIGFRIEEKGNVKQSVRYAKTNGKNI